MERLRILVTGAAGFIGSHTIDQLLQAGHSVYGVDNLRTGRLENISDAIKAGLEFHEFDILDSGRLNQLVQKTRIEVIIHCAALVSVQESIQYPEENYRLNILATRLVAEASLAAGTRRIVFASSAAVYGANDALPLLENAVCRPLSPYGVAKLESELFLLRFAETYKLTVRCQRYFNVFGPRQDPTSAYSGVISRFSAAVSQDLIPIIYGDGEQTRDFVYVGDVAQANMYAACAPNITTGVANVCTGSSVSLNELLSEINLITGKAIIPAYEPSRPGDIRHSCGSPGRAEKELGFKASTTLRTGLTALIQA